MKVIEVCDECTQNCVLIHGQKKDPSPVVISFLKLLYGNYDFSKFLYLPPEVSRKMSALRDQQNYDLEDSNGQRWTVTLANINNGLALDKGWNKFFTDHGLREGDTLIFNYIIGSHFVVQIYGKTGCQKLNFPEANGNQRKRSKTKGKFCAEDGECQMNFPEANGNQRKRSKTKGKICAEDGECHMNFIDLTNKEGVGTFVTSGSQNGSQSQPVTKDNNSSLNNRNGRLQLASTTDYDIEQFYMIDRDAGYKHEEDRSCLYDLSKFEMQRTRVDADGSNDKIPPHPSNAVFKSLCVAEIVNKNPVSTAVAGCEPPAEVATFAKIQKNNATSLWEKVATIDKDHQIGHPSVLLLKKSAVKNEKSKINSATTSKIVKCPVAAYRNKHSSEIMKVCKTEPMEMDKMSSCKSMNSGNGPKFFNELGGETMKVCKKELMEKNKMSGCKSMNSGKDPKFFDELDKSSSRAEKDNGEVFKFVKTEPVYSFNAYSPDTSNNSCLAVVGSSAQLELPECLPSISFRRASRKVVILRGPNTTLWPVLYQEKYGLKALASGWEAFCKSNSLRPGDECVFGLENGPDSVYSVNIVRNRDVC